MNENSKTREEWTKQIRDQVSELVAAIWAGESENYRDSPAYKYADEFYRNFKAQEGVDYTHAIQYARELYDRYNATDKLYDEKADSIIKYLGGGTGIIAAGALLAMKIDSQRGIILSLVGLASLVPALVCTCLAVHFALNVRKPRRAAMLPKIQFAIEMAHFHKPEELQINLWLVYYPLCEALGHRNEMKSEHVNKAHLFYRWALWLLVVPVMAIIISLITFLVIGAVPLPLAPKI